ncbi:hypothetical protein GO730_00940 [Spirosoma sp. HMF3257]|uniref:Lipoprotein n=1 Tax=Spirosoma telluris TaxID=2183553 RepID=A0A327NST0_9BACT|nr:hypothetical protein [Spirosoma telluris]RAI78302.1 hypothetical protein HMF3257_00915 [Spirosoma telluris]
MKWLSGFLIVGTTLFSACKSSDAQPNDLVSVGLHQSARLASEVVVRVDSIQDSRCPPGGVCIWAGETRVKLLLSTATDSSAVGLTLGVGNNAKRPDSTGVTLSHQTYKVVLRAVGPYPAQTATVQVAKL